MCRDLDDLYDDACQLEGRLYRRLWWQSNGEAERLSRIIARAKARRIRRGEALTECRDAEADSLAWAEAESIYEMERKYGR